MNKAKGTSGLFPCCIVSLLIRPTSQHVVGIVVAVSVAAAKVEMKSKRGTQNKSPQKGVE